MRDRAPAAQVLPLIALVALVSTGSSRPLPETAAAEETEIRLEMSEVGLLDQGCLYGDHTEVLVVKGSREAQLRFQVHSAKEDCAPEIVDFEIPRDEFLRLLNELIATRFDRLDEEYSGWESFRFDGDTGEATDTLSRITSISTHAGDTTVTLKMGAYEHSVRYHHGAKVPGLSEWKRRWVDALEERAGFRRHAE